MFFIVINLSLVYLVFEFAYIIFPKKKLMISLAKSSICSPISVFYKIHHSNNNEKKTTNVGISRKRAMNIMSYKYISSSSSSIGYSNTPRVCVCVWKWNYHCLVPIIGALCIVPIKRYTITPYGICVYNGRTIDSTASVRDSFFYMCELYTLQAIGRASKQTSERERKSKAK